VSRETRHFRRDRSLLFPTGSYWFCVGSTKNTVVRPFLNLCKAALRTFKVNCVEERSLSSNNRQGTMGRFMSVDHAKLKNLFSGLGGLGRSYL